MKEAVAAVKKGMSVREASLKFNVPRRTVGSHANGTISNFEKPGPKAELSAEEEEALVAYIKYMSNRCLPLRRNDLRGTILVCFKDILSIQFLRIILTQYDLHVINKVSLLPTVYAIKICEIYKYFKIIQRFFTLTYVSNEIIYRRLSNNLGKRGS